MCLSFEEAYKQYLIYIENRLKNQSKRTLKERFENKILPFWKNYDIYKINEIDYLKWQKTINENNYSFNYKSNLHYLMTSFFKFCEKKLNVNENIPINVGNFKKNINDLKKKSNTYTPLEFKKFIKCFDKNIYKSFFIFLYYTGTRPGEAMALKFSDLNKTTISINKTIDEHYDKETKTRIINTPKTLSSIRKIELNRFLYKMLTKIKKEYIKKYNNQNYDYFIFGGMKPLAPTTINRYKKKACEKANLTPIRLHDFRHSHATLLVNKKMPLKIVSERLGHSKTSTTIDIYVHVEEKYKKRVLKTLNITRLLF